MLVCVFVFLICVHLILVPEESQQAIINLPRHTWVLGLPAIAEHATDKWSSYLALGDGHALLKIREYEGQDKPI